jgi:hypothetical protein
MEEDFSEIVENGGAATLMIMSLVMSILRSIIKCSAECSTLNKHSGIYAEKI